MPRRCLLTLKLWPANPPALRRISLNENFSGGILSMATKSRSHRSSSRSKSSGSRSKSSGSRSKSSSRRKYSPSAGSDVKREMHEFKRGKLKSGRSGKTVKSRKQAIAIGLSEARRKGKKVPAKRSSSSSSRKAA
jgi:uncharacterized protein DUF6496